MIFEQVILVTL